MSARAWVTWTAPGFHCWPGIHAAGQLYLGNRHRHLFHYRVEVDVHNDDRDIEFHDLLMHCKAFTREEWEGSSCETIARGIADHVEQRWPDRHPAVTVSEDGECGATLQS